MTKLLRLREGRSCPFGLGDFVGLEYRTIRIQVRGLWNVWLRVRWCIMAERSVEELRDELNRLMEEQMESLRKQTFGGLDEEELRQHEERLKRIRELSADFLAALKRNLL